MPYFYRHSKQSYAVKDKRERDHIGVVSHDGDEGVDWEFKIVQYAGTPFRGLRLMMFDDAFVSLEDPQVLAGMQALQDCYDLDEAERILERVRGWLRAKDK